MFALFIDAIVFLLACAIFAGLLQVVDTVIRTLVDPHCIDRATPGLQPEKSEPA